MGAGDGQSRYALVGESTTIDLLHQRAAAVADDDARDGLQQGTVLEGDLFGRTYEDPARPVDGMCFDAGGYQAHDLVLEPLAVADVVLVPDHEVDHQAFQAPVRVAADHLAREIDVRRVRDLHQHDRQVAGNRVAPQTGLAAAILHQHAGLGPQRRISVEHGACKVAIQLRVGGARVDLGQDDVAVSPGEVEDAIGEVPILVFLDQPHAGFAAAAGARDEIERRRLTRFERNVAADRDDRIKHRALGAGERGAFGQRERRGGRASAADESHAIGFVRNPGDVRAARREKME